MSATAGPTGRIGSSLLLLSSLLAYGLLYAPIAVMALFSFNAPRGRFNLLWQGFTLANWRHPLKDAALTQAFLTSLALALAAALLAVLLGGLMALGLSRARRRGLRWRSRLSSPDGNRGHSTEPLWRIRG